MTALPSQVKEQIEAAKKLREQMYGDPAQSEGSTTESATTEATTENTAQAVDAAGTDAPAQQAPAQQTVVSTQQTATSAEDENSATYASRWRSLQGINNALQSRITSLEHMIAAMQSAPPPQQQHQPQPVQVQRLITEKDETEYGSDMVDFARRVTREEMSPVMQALNSMQKQLEQLSTLAPAVQQVAVKQQASTEEQFFNKLGTAVPDWAQVNDHPAFHEWLLTPDSMTGITRQTYLADAQRNFDLGRVVSIFNAWKREAGVQPVAAPAAQTQSTDSRLEKQVAPGRANAATAAPQQKAEKVWTRSSIAAFYEDKRTGKFKGREAEMAAMEKDIFQAQKQGRVDFAAA